jgi:tetratricopeptide (TPR) repeat protein
MPRTLALAVFFICLAAPALSPAQEKPEDDFAVEPGRSAEEYYNIGNWYAQRDQHFRAIAYFRAAIGLREDFVEAWINMGASLSAAERFEEAVDAYQRAIEIGAEENFIYLNLGNAYAGAGELRQAVIAFRTFTSLEPYDPDGYSNLGITLFRLEDYAAAVEEFEKYLLLEKENAFFAFQAARCYALLGRHEEALEKIRIALTIDPNVRQALMADDDFRGFRRSQFYRQLQEEQQK